MRQSPISDSFIRISVRQALAIVVCVAVSLGLAKTRPLVFAVVVPGILGVSLAQAARPTRDAIFAGLIAAYFFAALIALVAVPILGLVHVVCNGIPARPRQSAAIASAIIGGLLGGVVGARFGRSRLAESAEPNDARDGESSE